MALFRPDIGRCRANKARVTFGRFQSLFDLTVPGADEMKLRPNIEWLNYVLVRFGSLSGSKRMGAALMGAAGLLLPSVTLPQGIATGSISGTVADPSGAVVPGAKVTAVNLATNTASTV